MDVLDPNSIFERAKSLCSNGGFYDARVLLEDYGPQITEKFGPESLEAATMWYCYGYSLLLAIREQIASCCDFEEEKEIAWDALQNALDTLEKYSSKKAQLLLGDVCLVSALLAFEADCDEQDILAFCKRAIDIKTALLPPLSLDLANLYFEAGEILAFIDEEKARIYLNQTISILQHLTTMGQKGHSPRIQRAQDYLLFSNDEIRSSPEIQELIKQRIALQNEVPFVKPAIVPQYDFGVVGGSSHKRTAPQHTEQTPPTIELKLRKEVTFNKKRQGTPNLQGKALKKHKIS